MEDRILEHYLDEFQGGIDLTPAEAEPIFDSLIKSRNAELIAQVLIEWNKKGSTEDEVFELARIIRARMKRVNSRHEIFVDNVGTGGSLVKTFNVSTASAFVISASGLPVAKHGNKAATSSSGSSDALTELGIDVDVEPEVSERNLNEHDLCFMFAPRFHSFSPVLAAARRMVGRPTIFNNLGPLCNPASAPHYVIGVWNVDWVEKTARVLARLGAKRSWIVHSSSGLDEIAISGVTHVAEINNGELKTFEIAAPDFGVYTLGNGLPDRCSPRQSASLIKDVLTNNKKNDDSERLILINAAAALYVAGHTANLREAYELAETSIRSGAASEKMSAFMRPKK